MKFTVTATLLLFWAVTTALLAAGFVLADRTATPSVDVMSADANGTTAPTVGIALSTLTMAKLAKHNSSQSCWLLISGKIYDVTNFISAHPGGTDEILLNCGTDATQAFATQGGQGSHSTTAANMLADYYIGDLNQTVTTSPTQTAPQPQQPVPQGDDDEEEEND